MNKVSSLVKDLTGQRVGRLVVVKYVFQKRHGRNWECICDCGKATRVATGNLKTGGTISCGCFTIDRVVLEHTTHGLSKHKLYSIWDGMHQRCYNPKNTAYHSYGGRGVIICDEWKSEFLSFYSWAMDNGYGDKLQIDKDILGDGKLYSPSTCCFVSSKTNCQNRRTSVMIEYNGDRYCIKEWAGRLNISYPTLCWRLKNGWGVDLAFSTHPNQIKSNQHIKRATSA